MFIQQKNNAIFHVSLTLDKVLMPFWNLTRNLLGDSLLRDRDYSRYDSDFQQEKEAYIARALADFDKHCKEIYSGEGTEEEKQEWLAAEDKIKLDTVFMKAFDCICSFYLDKALSTNCLDKISESCSLIIYKEHQEDCWFVTEDGLDGKFDKEFQNCLSSIRLVDDFIKFLNGGIEEYNGYNPRIYANVFPNPFEDNAVSIASPIYPIDIFSQKEDIEKKETDFKVWFNIKKLRTLGYEPPQSEEVYEFKAGDTIVALTKGQYLIPMITDWQNYFNITNRALIAWIDYTNKIYNNKEKDNDNKQRLTKTKMNPLEKEFVEAAKHSESFTNLLSYLSDNLYLPPKNNIRIESYEKFFDLVLKVEELKHLPDYKVFVPKQDEGTVLGVYKIHKLAGETSYNLRHMLYSEKNGDNTVFKDYNTERQRNVNSVMVLKPQYASFYIMDYYEFLVEEVLKSLKERGVIKDYLRNQRYTYKSQDINKSVEVDALVFNGQKVFFLELKTTLHIEFLNIYPQKYSAMIENESYPDLYEFYLISSFADDNIAILKYDEKDGYNVRREGLNSVPYKFSVAIPVKEEAPKKDLHCLSESSFEKLKAELQRVFTV